MPKEDSMKNKQVLVKLAQIKLAMRHVIRQRMTKKATIPSMAVDSILLNQYLNAMKDLEPSKAVQYKPTTPRSDDLFQAANDLESALGYNWEKLTPKQRAEITALRGALEWYYETGCKPSLDNMYADLK